MNDNRNALKWNGKENGTDENGNESSRTERNGYETERKRERKMNGTVKQVVPLKFNKILLFVKMDIFL